MEKKLKDRLCKNKKCGLRFTPARPLQGVCSPKCAYEYQKLLKENKEKKEWRDEKKKIKEKIKTLTDHENEAKTIFQKWTRLRDSELPCISCGAADCSEWSGGHYFDAGVYSGLIFHEWNVNKQCNAHCNKFLHGNKANYRIGLVKKIGEENVRWLEENKDRLRNYKYTKDQLIEIKEEYKLKIKQLL